MRPALQNTLINLLILVGTIVIFFGGIELGLRVTGIDKGRQSTPPVYAKDPNPDIAYRLRPNLHVSAFRSTVTTDAAAFRVAPAEPAGKPIVAMLGDSILFGYGVNDDETLAARLEALYGGQYRFLNAGVPGYNLKQEAALYQTNIAALHPKALVIVYFPNDLQDMEPAWLDATGTLQQAGKWVDTQGCHPIEQGLLAYIPGRCWLDLHSAFYRTLRKFVSTRSSVRSLQQQQAAPPASPYIENVPPERVALYDQEFTAFAKTLPPDLRRLLVIWPDHDLHFVNRPKIAAIAQKNGFQVLDLYDVFGNQAQTLSWDTVHPSVKTISNAAAIVKATLEYRKILP